MPSDPAYRGRAIGCHTHPFGPTILIACKEMDSAVTEGRPEGDTDAPVRRDPEVRADLRRGIAARWWTFLVRGLLSVAFGLAALVWPDVTLLVLLTIFAAFALVDGVISVMFGLTGREKVRWWMVLWGLVGVAAGVIVFLQPGIGAVAFVYLIAAWAIITGSLELAAALAWRREIRNEWVLAVAGVLSILVGAVMAVFPGDGAVALVWLIGAHAVVLGVLLVIVAFRIRELRGHMAAGR